MNPASVRMLNGQQGRESAAKWKGAPKGSHEWVSFPDPEEERTWLFDVTFLESNWTCIFGRGCQGVLTGPAPELVQGCCSYGAHMTGGKDARRVEKAARALSPEQWQFWRQGQPASAKAKGPAKAKGSANGKAPAKGKRMNIFTKNRTGEMTTRLVRDACIFLNRPDFAGGPGCALHRAALDRDVPHVELKPDVCWQLPLRREDETAEDGHVTSIIRQWDRRDWGDGGFEFHWWCTESPDAFVGTVPVYREMRHELEALVGAKIYRRLVKYLETRASVIDDEPHIQPVALPHPAVRRN